MHSPCAPQWPPPCARTPLATGKLSTRKLDGTEKRIGGEIATHAHEAFSPSIYARDGFEKLFR